ncbi:MFS transporter [Prauserella oleivorans]
MTSAHALQVREIRDFYGRRYRVGESDRDLLGRSRGWMLWCAWLAMLAASLGQYGYGALMPVIADTHGWTLAQSGWVLAVWILCQSGAVYPAARLRTTLGLRPAAPMIVGAALCGAGLVSLGGSGSFAAVLLSHGVLGGIGAGLIYGTALGVVARWYPERPGRTAFVGGAFAYGSIPFVVLAGQFSRPRELETFLGIAGVAVVVVVSAAAVLLRDPPEHWWPSHVDPRRWALDKSLNPGLRVNRPPIRRYSAAELLRCRASILLVLAVTCLTAMILFDIAYLAVFATHSGWSVGFGAVVLAVLAAASGATRTAEGWAGDRFGRPRVVRTALCAGDWRSWSSSSRVPRATPRCSCSAPRSPGRRRARATACCPDWSRVTSASSPGCRTSPSSTARSRSAGWPGWRSRATSSPAREATRCRSPSRPHWAWWARASSGCCASPAGHRWRCRARPSRCSPGAEHAADRPLWSA